MYTYKYMYMYMYKYIYMYMCMNMHMYILETCFAKKKNTLANSARISANSASILLFKSATSLRMSVKSLHTPLSTAATRTTSFLVSTIRCFWMISMAFSTLCRASCIRSRNLPAVKKRFQDSFVLATSSMASCSLDKVRDHASCQ